MGEQKKIERKLRLLQGCIGFAVYLPVAVSRE